MMLPDNPKERFIYPEHPMVSNWQFTEDEEHQANLLDAMAKICERNAIPKSELMHLFPAVLRMLNEKEGEWIK